MRRQNKLALSLSLSRPDDIRARAFLVHIPPVVCEPAAPRLIGTYRAPMSKLSREQRLPVAPGRKGTAFDVAASNSTTPLEFSEDDPTRRSQFRGEISFRPVS